MNKQIKITITRDDFFQLLLERGFHIPDSVAIRGGEESWASDIDFPIVLRWEEVYHVPFRLDFRFPLAKMTELSNVPPTNNGHRKIPAIRKVREWTGWSLKECKDWVEHHMPGFQA